MSSAAPGNASDPRAAGKFAVARPSILISDHQRSRTANELRLHLARSPLDWQRNLRLPLQESLSRRATSDGSGYVHSGGRDSNPRPSGYEPILGVFWGVVWSGDLVLLLGIWLLLDLAMSWNGVEHVCTLFAPCGGFKPFETPCRLSPGSSIAPLPDNAHARATSTRRASAGRTSEPRRWRAAQAC